MKYLKRRNGNTYYETPCMHTVELKEKTTLTQLY